MKYRLGNSVKIKQRLTIRKVVIMTSLAFTVAGIAVLVMQLKNPQTAMAAACESSYVLNWSDTSTYDVSCGTVNASNWAVKGSTCFYYSPVFNVGGIVGQPDKMADFAVRINQSGNLDGNDTAWVYMYANDSLIKTYAYHGDSVSAVFSTYHTLNVPAGGTYRLVIKLMNDKANEFWQIKNGDVNSCLRSYNPLPLTLGTFTARPDADGKMLLKWSTFTEINNSYFTIEHSNNGKDFEELAQLEGSGNSTSLKNYAYLDESPYPGLNYYRLKQTDYDGTTTTSAIIKAAVSKNTKSGVAMQVFPNPFSESFSTKFESETEQNISIRIVTMDGRIIFSENHQAEEGWNTISCNPPQGMKKGSYLIQVASDDKVLNSVRAICN